MRLHPRKIRYRRVIVISILIMVIVPILLVWSNAMNKPSVSSTNRDASLPSPLCREGDPLAGIYNPLRFHILSNCEVGSGLVRSIAVQADGTIWIDVAVDHQYSKLLGPGNTSHQMGLLVLEDSSGSQAPAFSIGERISFVGPLVYDANGGFNAIAPVWSVVVS